MPLEKRQLVPFSSRVTERQSPLAVEGHYPRLLVKALRGAPKAVGGGQSDAPNGS
jgi:hypothetical protein